MPFRLVWSGFLLFKALVQATEFLPLHDTLDELDLSVRELLRLVFEGKLKALSRYHLRQPFPDGTWIYCEIDPNDILTHLQFDDVSISTEPLYIRKFKKCSSSNTFIPPFIGDCDVYLDSLLFWKTEIELVRRTQLEERFRSEIEPPKEQWISLFNWRLHPKSRLFRADDFEDVLTDHQCRLLHSCALIVGSNNRLIVLREEIESTISKVGGSLPDKWTPSVIFKESPLWGSVIKDHKVRRGRYAIGMFYRASLAKTSNQPNHGPAEAENSQTS